jgi:hypothetical protein
MPIGLHPSIRTSPQHVWAASWYRPFMSTWSIWSRLCECNALTAPGARAILGKTGLHGSVFRARREDAWIDHASSLSEAQRAAACCTTLFHPSAVEWRVLRFCPLCMEGGFHCGCFQHLALTRCPVHDVELQDCCSSCGAAVSPSFEMARSAVFACRNCERRLTRIRVAAAGDDSANDPIWRSTNASLVWNGQSTPPRARRDRTSSEAANASWWNGHDPFIAASTWIPQETLVVAGGDNFNELAWRELIDQVKSLVGQDKVPGVLGIVGCLMRQSWLTRHLLTLPSEQWAAACVVAQYGGAPAFERAMRLMPMGVRNELHWVFPQVSTTVVASAAGNAIIVRAELRSALARAWRLVRRLGFEALVRDGVPLAASRVVWSIDQRPGDRLRLQWRSPGIARRFKRMASKSVG